MENKFDLTEDEGIDLNKPKVPIKEDEEETPEQKAKKKKILIGVSSVLILLACSLGIFFIFLNQPQVTERVLPFDVTDTNGYNNYEGASDLTDEDWLIIETVTDTGNSLSGIVTSPCNLVQSPSPYGNGIKGLNVDDVVTIEGEVVVDDETTGWLLVRKDDYEGYIFEDKLEINLEDTVETNLSEEEKKYLNMFQEEILEELEKKNNTETDEETAKEIDEKALLREMEIAIEEDRKKQEDLQQVEENQVIQPPFHNQQTGKYYNADGVEIDEFGNPID